MAYNFLDGLGGYAFDSLSMDVQKFDNRDTYGYNNTYIIARRNIDWRNLGADINQKIQFLSDWNTTIVRANKSLYAQKFKEVGEYDALRERLSKYDSIELTDIKVIDDNSTTDIEFIYDTLDCILGPTSASKVLHMYNPDFFPIWDDYMRRNLFHFRSHKPYQYVKLIELMHDELSLILDKLVKSEEIDRTEAILKVKQLDQPTLSLLRILDKVNYNNSRTVINFTTEHPSAISKNEGGNSMNIVFPGKQNTGLKLSEFLTNILPQIETFSMNKSGGYTYEEERSLWVRGKMTAAFLKKVASMLEYQTFQSSNYDLLNSLKRDRENLIDVLKRRPHLDKEIILKTKGPTGSGTLKSGLLE